MVHQGREQFDNASKLSDNCEALLSSLPAVLREGGVLDGDPLDRAFVVLTHIIRHLSSQIETLDDRVKEATKSALLAVRWYLAGIFGAVVAVSVVLSGCIGYSLGRWQTPLSLQVTEQTESDAKYVGLWPGAGQCPDKNLWCSVSSASKPK